MSPKSTPKLHHYVPRWLLRRFSTDPSARNPPIHRLDKKSGQPRLAAIAGETAITHYNRTSVPGLERGEVEDVLAQVDAKASVISRKLIDGEAISLEERLEMALAIFMQQQRSPRARKWSVFMQEQLALAQVQQRTSDPEEVRAFLKRRGELATDAEVESLHRRIQQSLANEEVEASASHDQEVIAMFAHVDEIPLQIATEMSWTVARAAAGEFIVSDHPLYILDADAARRGQAAGWFSSTGVQVTLPIDRTASLILTPGQPRLEEAQVARRLVDEINLRTYASAEWAIYGASQGVLQRVRSEARRSKAKVERLKVIPPSIEFEVTARHGSGQVLRRRAQGPVPRGRRRSVVRREDPSD